MPKIFVSYRRSDAQEEARRVADRAIDEFGASSVFYDTDTMAPGVSFPTEILANIGTSTAMLVMIGPDWLTLDKETGKPRIHNSGDWVRNEVRTALEQRKLVIPVLVKNARMPGRGVLPEDLKSLADQNAISLTPDTFKGQLDTLVGMLHDKSPLQTAGIVLITSVIAGLLYYFVTDIYKVLAFTLQSIQVLAEHGPEFDKQIGLDGETILGSGGIAYQAKAKLLESGAGQSAQVAVQIVLGAIYWAIVASGALMAARGYVGIGRDRILPAVFLAASFYVVIQFVLRAVNDWFPVVYPSLYDGDIDGKKLVDLIGGEVYWPIQTGLIYTAFALGLLIVLRRQLRARGTDILYATLCVFAASVAARYLISWTWVPKSTLMPFAEMVTDPEIRVTLFYYADDYYLPDAKIWINRLLDRAPFCLASEIAQGAKTCGEMDYMIRISLRFAFLLGLACLVKRWRLSPWPPFLMGAGLLLFSLFMVNAMALLDLATVDSSRFFADASIIQAILFAAIAYLLARWPIRRHAPSAIAQA